MSNPVVLVDTTKGEFLVELFADRRRRLWPIF